MQEKEDVPMEMSGAEPDCQHYEQLHYNSVWYKVGDCVYIQSHGLSKPRVARWVNLSSLCKDGFHPNGMRCHSGVVELL